VVLLAAAAGRLPPQAGGRNSSNSAAAPAAMSSAAAAPAPAAAAAASVLPNLYQGVDKASFGFKMLASLGWKEGQGLVRVLVSEDSAGSMGPAAVAGRARTRCSVNTAGAEVAACRQCSTRMRLLAYTTASAWPHGVLRHTTTHHNTPRQRNAVAAVPRPHTL
jgi:hypothetical protein